MKRTAWKWIFGISLALLILLILFTVGVWVLLNIGGAIMLTLMGNTEISAMPFGEFMANFIGSPAFCMSLTVLAVHAISVVALIVTRKRK